MKWWNLRALLQRGEVSSELSGVLCGSPPLTGLRGLYKKQWRKCSDDDVSYVTTFTAEQKLLLHEYYTKIREKRRVPEQI